MSEIMQDNIKIDRCNTCKSTFLDFMELKAMILWVQKSKSFTQIPIKKVSERHKGTIYACPKCKNSMSEREYNYGSKIHIDLCKHCWGVYLDKSELKQIKNHEKKVLKRQQERNERKRKEHDIYLKLRNKL
jgi:Zn-finger nucleic acid-binding protein